MFSFLKRKDPICGMREKDGIGLEAHGKWFCSKACLDKFENGNDKNVKEKCGCCP